MRHCCDTKEEVRTRILDSVGRLLIRYGYRKMTVEDIALEAGIGKGTIYLYFQGKEDVALGWAQRSGHVMHVRMAQIADSNADPTERLRTMLITRVMDRFDGVQGFVDSLDDIFAAIRPSFHRLREQNYEAEASILKRVLDEGMESGIFSPGNNDRIAHAMLTATNSLLPYSLSPAQLGCRDEIEAKAGQIVDLLLNGFLSRITSSSQES